MPVTYDSKFHLDNIVDQFGKDLDADKVKDYCSNHDIGYQTITKFLNQYKTKRGHWKVTVKQAKKQLENTYVAPVAPVTPVNVGIAKTDSTAQQQNLVPERDGQFVRFGQFPDLKKVVASNMFYPVFITGMSGNGKTFGVEQACAEAGRELIRVNITIETDEDDLIGGFRLVNGQTVWHNGAVIEALERGAVLLLDEIDLASNKIMCLQSILEGKGLFLKKIGEYIKPKHGFNIIATANTKGKGSDDGRFIGTNVLNEAFLERFPITFEQDYPSAQTENKILTKCAESLSIPMIGETKKFITHLCSWADIVRRTFNEGGVDEVISTRRLTHVIKAYSIFGDKMKAVKMCLNRFDDETKESFIQLYSKLDETVELNTSDEVQT
tara:strand:- start:4262 stop:5407 length:1146 start_codon:yes stop_codon:yes gene_type:complete